MKKLMIAAIAFSAVTASAAQYVTVQVCDRGESGTQCENVTYQVRPSTGVPKHSDAPISDEEQFQPPKAYGIPAWLRKLNEAFGGSKRGPAPEPCGNGELYPCL